jgi:hypothetical protein
MLLTKAELLVVISGIKPGARIPGINPGKFYRFGGLEPYNGRGRYNHLKGQMVILLHSPERKRSSIRLFIEPLLLLCNSKIEDLTYGNLSISYPTEFIDAEWQVAYPNLSEFTSHYKSLARYIKRRIKG